MHAQPRRFLLSACVVLALVALAGASRLARPLRAQRGQAPAAAGARKKLLALGDTHTGFTHDSIGHALSVIDRLGRESGLYDTYIRTDSQWITKQPVPSPARNARNLNDFDAVFLFISGEGDWTDQQKNDFLSFVRDDGKGVVGAHTGNAAFYQWPEFGEMMGGYFDNHPWNVTPGTVVVEAPDFPAMRHLPPTFRFTEEFYVLREKPYSRQSVRVLAHLDPSTLDLKTPDYHRKDTDIPVALAHEYGKGRTFWSVFGHSSDTWDDPAVQTMYLEAIKWAMKLTDGDAKPR
ncbi:MAG: ThuA domain-containing protein [Vicinamibacterales bacterium]